MRRISIGGQRFALAAVLLYFCQLAARAWAVQLGTDESLNDRILTHTTGAITGSFSGTTLTISWDGILSGLDLNSKKLVYTERMGDFSWGYNLALDLANGAGSGLITNSGWTGTNGMISTSGKGEDSRTGCITITNAADITVGMIDTRNTQRYPTGVGGGMPCGSVTVANSGSVQAGKVRTGRSGPQSFTGDKSGLFRVTMGLEARGYGCDISISGYSAVQIDGGVLTGSINGGSGYPGVPIGSLYVGATNDMIPGCVTIRGGIDMSNTTSNDGSPAPSRIRIYCGGDIAISGEIDMRKGTSTTNPVPWGSVVLVSTNGTIFVEQLDMKKISSIMFQAGSKKSHIAGALANFDRSGNGASGALDAPAGQKVLYRPTLPANAYLTQDGYTGIYTLKNGGKLMPEPLGTVLALW